MLAPPHLPGDVAQDPLWPALDAQPAHGENQSAARLRRDWNLGHPAISPTLSPVSPKILVIRGGAIGDFILTLPAIGLLREAFPAAHLEVLGYEHIAAVATAGGFADARRSIEYGPMGAFFNPRAELDPELCAYFGSFQQVVSFLFDPDDFFSGNLRRCGVKNLIVISPRIDPEGDHAVRQLARPLDRLALYLEEAGARWKPGPPERAFAADFLRAEPRPIVALHPGSGGERKNWPVERWLELAAALAPRRLLVIGGEADAKAMAAFRGAGLPHARFAGNLPLPQVGALLAGCDLFIGHDSGISHLAAAAGAPCLLLFGPTDPDIWAPPHDWVYVLSAPGGQLSALPTAEVLAAALGVLREPGP